MKQLLEFFPLLVFFAVYKFVDIFAATGALIAASALQLVLLYLLYKKVEKMQLITFGMVAVFGAATLLFHDDAFIKWKVTVVYAIFSLGLLISHLMGKSALKAMLGQALTLPDPIWRNLTFAWSGFFAFCAILNTYIAFNWTLEAWVSFKVFGFMGLMLAFMVLNGLYLYKHMPKEQTDNNSSDS